jgi:CheY-like chemotaxis protein
MDEATIRVWIDLLGALPPILWFGIVAAILIVYRRHWRDYLSRLGSIEALGIRLDCIREGIEGAVRLAKKSQRWHLEVPATDEARVLERTKRNARLFRGAQILWVDDEPQNCLNERRMFGELGCCVDSATATEGAFAVLGADPAQRYDLIVSDIARGSNPRAGIEMLPLLRERGITTPVILYVGDFDPAKGVPPHAFGITHRPDELLHLALDVFERSRA